jgi:hypothetical protein
MFSDRTNTAVKTDGDGRYYVKEKRNFYLVGTIGPCCNTWPEGKPYVNWLSVSHPAYSNQLIAVEALLPPRFKDEDYLTLKDILLAPKPK